MINILSLSRTATISCICCIIQIRSDWNISIISGGNLSLFLMSCFRVASLASAALSSTKNRNITWLHFLFDKVRSAHSWSYLCISLFFKLLLVCWFHQFGALRHSYCNFYDSNCYIFCIFTLNNRWVQRQTRPEMEDLKKLGAKTTKRCVKYRTMFYLYVSMINWWNDLVYFHF